MNQGPARHCQSASRSGPVRTLLGVLLTVLALPACLETEFQLQPVFDISQDLAVDAPADATPDAADDVTADVPSAEVADTVGDAVADAAPEVTQDADAVEPADGATGEVSQDAGPTGLPMGHTCTVAADCQSQVCLDTKDAGKICTEPCAGDCPAGMRCGIDLTTGQATQPYCLLLPVDLCEPCTVDSDCAGGACVPIASTKESLCGMPCGEASGGQACPVGFECQSFLKGELCVPTLGTCTCGESIVGQSWPCATESPLGACQGAQTCTATGWSLCSAPLPTVELCDGLDNDCNGKTDETYTSLGTPCGQGQCAGGKLQCADDHKSLVCSTEKKKPTKDTCGDNLDNDCDGQTDEQCPPKDVDGDGTPDVQDCAPYLPESHPGAPEPCCAALPKADDAQPVATDDKTKACDVNCDGKVLACGTKDADGDGFPAPDDCDDKDKTVFPGAKDMCADTIDQDCDGSDAECTANSDQDGDLFNKKYDCDDDAKQINPLAKEICNDIDDDCDSVVDDGNPGGGAACGSTSGECKAGTLVCKHAGVGLPPSVTCTDQTLGDAELCNGKDDDCDNQTDEDFADLGKSCDGDDADSCKSGKFTCAADGSGVACASEAVYDVAETCKGSGEGNNQDEDCDGITDETCYGADIDGDGVTGAADCNELDAGFHPKIKNEPCCDPSLGTGPAAKLACDRNCDGDIKACDPADADFDGFVGADDCSPADPGVHSGAPEKCGDGIDQDCDNADLTCEAIAGGDDDGDGFANGVDCKPLDKAVNPLETELCNGKDDDCDGATDEGNPGADPGPCGSSDGQCVPGQQMCVHISFKAQLLCVPKVGPVAEQCNSLDDNCNGKTDEYFFKLGKPCDGPDGDSCENGTWTCGQDGKAEVCANEKIKDLYELCNGVDDDCDGQTDEGMVYFGKKLGDDCDGLGACGGGKVVCSPELQVPVCSTDYYGTTPEASPEVCNGTDDDCDGQTDEGMTFGGKALGETCVGNGACKIAGKVECAKGTSIVGAGKAICSTMLGGSQYQGKGETCNGIDDNCDGHVDEGMGVADSTCKQAGVCTVQNVQATCKLGKWQCNYAQVSGYQGDKEVLCDAIDNDCDGKADEDFEFGLPCDGTDTDQCKNGKWQCSGDKLDKVCGAESVSDIVEQCNGQDDDCDGLTDEGFDVGKPCDGDDTDECKNGTWQCATDGKSAICTNESKVNLSELCNGEDDDCDGSTDEAFPDLGGACDGPDSDQCKLGITVCTTDGKATTCGTEAKTDIAEVCDSSDNDCDGATDEEQAYEGKGMGQACSGIGACGPGNVVCSPKTLKATCSTNPDAYLIFDGQELCDGLDNDCNGKVDDNLTYKGQALGEACSGIGACGAGKVECGKDKQVTCSSLKNGSAYQGKAETCNAQDDDCDGIADNGLTVKDSTCLQAGVCATDKLQAACEGGQWKCTYAGIPGWQAEETLCDGLDNDCDGQTDEGFDIGKACDGDDTDQCTTGTWTCAADGSKHVCENETVTNVGEVCDGKDNDCDGGTDEEFTYGDANLKLGQACDGLGACGMGTVVCGKNLVATCSTDPDGPLNQAKPETCDSVDNDCNGKTDDTLKYNDLPVGAPCSGIGDCGLGTVVCSSVGKPVCSVNPDGPSNQAKAETCDGKDNDCDGTTDEELDPKKSNCNVVGVCAAALTATCSGGAWKCAYNGFGFEKVESTCDDKDNDCNGVTDDPYLNKGKACDGPDTDLCKTGTLICAASGKALECQESDSGGGPTAEICDNKDNDCNGSVDEPYPDVGQACDGADTDLCPNGTWTCTKDAKGVECVNEIIKNLQEACDGKDNDCDGDVDEDLGLGEACDGPDIDSCKFGTWTCGDGGKVVCGNESKKDIPELCNNKDDDCDGEVDEGFAQKGKKCDVATDIDSCETGSYQCTPGGTLACIGDVACVGGTKCSLAKNATELDQCVCGTTAICSINQGDSCGADGKCLCKGGPACGFGQTCTSTGCK